MRRASLGLVLTRNCKSSKACGLNSQRILDGLPWFQKRGAWMPGWRWLSASVSHFLRLDLVEVFAFVEDPKNRISSKFYLALNVDPDKCVV